MSALSVLYCVYGLVLGVGGIIGFRKAKSLPSLVGGIVSGDLAIAAGVLLDLHHPRSGLGLGVLVSLAVIILFVRRYTKTRKAMPAFPIIVLSLVVLAFSMARLLTATHHA